LKVLAKFALCVVISSFVFPATTHADGIQVLNIREVLIGEAQQLVVVENAVKESSSAKLSVYIKSEVGWRKQFGSIPVRIGRSGFSERHREGDGTTPMGSYGIPSVFGIAPVPENGFPYIRIRENYCWVLRQSEKTYNTMVKGSKCVRGGEDLFRIAQGGPYRRSIVLDFNMNPVVRGHGGAIFIHSHSYYASGKTKPTSGCVSMTSAQLLKVLKLIDSKLQTRVVMGTKSFLGSSTR
jgi:L,D-peptidoglycan transpeptidase YkuD (ErfK/YbiS/YcfS/YnhG family)